MQGKAQEEATTPDQKGMSLGADSAEKAPQSGPMSIFWSYLKPQKWLIIWALLLAAASQLLTLGDVVVFGTIIDKFVTNAAARTEAQFLNGVLFWVLLAIGIA